MLRYKQFLNEERKVNTHLRHLEELVLDGDVDGTRQAINYLRSMRDMLAGHAKTAVNVTVKWDGAPAIFAGIDPTDGKFFVAKKGIFNKNPKVYKTAAEVDDDTTGELAMKLKLALAELPALGIKGVVQGDFLYSKEDLKIVDIDGEPHVTFHPNTIVYAIPKNSALGKTILASKLGVVWHTTYRGASFEDMSASFGEEIASGLKTVKNVWSVDAVYKDVSGTASFTAAETALVTNELSKAGKIFQSLPRAVFTDFANNTDLLERSKVFINSKIRIGEPVTNPSKFVSELRAALAAYYDKEIAAKKTEKSKTALAEKKDAVDAYFIKHGSKVVDLFVLYNHIVNAKLMIIRKLDKAKQVGTFLKMADGLKVTEQEGFVAIDHASGNAVKFVDRLSFSNANFSSNIIKGWEKK